MFSAMGVPACLWRRTGEIYKGNREFSELVGINGYLLRDGKLCIYELMAEESAVNYWEVCRLKGSSLVMTSNYPSIEIRSCRFRLISKSRTHFLCATVQTSAQYQS